MSDSYDKLKAQKDTMLARGDDKAGGLWYRRWYKSRQEIERLRAENERLRESLLRIDALCPVSTGGMTDAALAGLLFNIESHVRSALQETDSGT